MEYFKWIAYAVIAIACVGAIAFKIYYDRARAAKGSVKVNLKDRATKPGEIITGVIDLQANQDLDVSALDIRLTCSFRVHSGGGGTGGSRTHHIKLYRETVRVRDAFQLAAGQSDSFAFSIPMPSRHLDGPDEQKVREKYTEDDQHDMKWELDALVNCKGIDLKNTLRLVVPWIRPENRQAA